MRLGVEVGLGVTDGVAGLEGTGVTNFKPLPTNFSSSPSLLSSKSSNIDFNLSFSICRSFSKSSIVGGRPIILSAVLEEEIFAIWAGLAWGETSFRLSLVVASDDGFV